MSLFVAVEAFYLSCRSGGIAVQLAPQGALTYLPAVNDLFQTAPISARAFAGIVAAGLVMALASEGAKHWHRA